MAYVYGTGGGKLGKEESQIAAFLFNCFDWMDLKQVKAPPIKIKGLLAFNLDLPTVNLQEAEFTKALSAFGFASLAWSGLSQKQLSQKQLKDLPLAPWL